MNQQHEQENLAWVTGVRQDLRTSVLTEYLLKETQRSMLFTSCWNRMLYYRSPSSLQACGRHSGNFCQGVLEQPPSWAQGDFPGRRRSNPSLPPSQRGHMAPFSIRVRAAECLVGRGALHFVFGLFSCRLLILLLDYLMLANITKANGNAMGLLEF